MLAHLPLRWLLAALLVVVLAVGHGLWLGVLGTFLVAADPLQTADAIIVLAGQTSSRAARGVELYQAGYAPRFIVSDEPLATHGLKTTWSELHQRGIAPLPVPDAALFILPESFSTYEEALKSRDLLLREGLRSAILVTDPFHSRRAIMTFAHVFEPAGLAVRVSPSRDAPYGLERWWQNKEKTRDVALEYVKFVYYFALGRL